MAIRIQRHLGPVRSLDPGQWTSETLSGRPAMSCPACETVTEILSEVAVDGTVEKAVHCDKPTCNFHEWILLEAYGE